MRKINVSAIFAVVLLGATLMSAQATRTWVSGVGDDANPCSRTAPCKTFAGAISKTAPGGEIDALDPGGFGALTITKAITIDGGGGQNASILVAGTPGVTVAAGVNDVVTIRNMSINGIGSGTNGINFVSGKALHIEHSVIQNFTQNGVNISNGNQSQVFISDTTCRNNGQNGVSAVATSRVFISINRSRFVGNNINGVLAGDFSRFSVRDSEASGNTVNGFLAQANNGDVAINIINSVAVDNLQNGIQAGGGAT